MLLGSSASILIMISVDPWLVFKNVFHESPFLYYLSYIGYLALIAATALIVMFLVRPFAEYTVTNFAIKLLISCIVPNALWLLVFRKSRNMRLMLSYIKKILVHIKMLRVKNV